MNTQKKYGLIGKNISYSFSKNYFNQKFKKLMLHDHYYDLYHLEYIDLVKDLLKDPNLRGFNVTQPYKQSIIPYLDELDPIAEEIHAVNTVLIKNGKTKGYNTDVDGFEKSLLLYLNHNKSNAALVLGNGGAANAVKYVLKKHKIPYITVSRTGKTTFSDLTSQFVSSHSIIIQCTPVGTHPNIEDCLPFPFEGINENHLIIDLIYNPIQTTFMKQCAQKGAKTLNGLYMLEMQAEKAWEIWSF